MVLTKSEMFVWFWLFLYVLLSFRANPSEAEKKWIYVTMIRSSAPFFCSLKHSLCCRHFYDIHCSGSQASSGASWCTPFHPLISASFLHTTFSTRSKHVETVSKFTKSLYDLSVLKRRESWFLGPSTVNPLVKVTENPIASSILLHHPGDICLLAIAFR